MELRIVLLRIHGCKYRRDAARCCLELPHYQIHRVVLLGQGLSEGVDTTVQVSLIFGQLLLHRRQAGRFARQNPLARFIVGEDRFAQTTQQTTFTCEERLDLATIFLSLNAAVNLVESRDNVPSVCCVWIPN